jgi:long-chain acyl-CoA synthetase
VGELTVRGPSVMLGYFGQPELTAQKIRDGWLYAGDGAYTDADGFVHLVDRIKDMIITGGENVYSTEVETVLAGHPAVAMCAVIGIPHRSWGASAHAGSSSGTRFRCRRPERSSRPAFGPNMRTRVTGSRPLAAAKHP